MCAMCTHTYVVSEALTNGLSTVFLHQYPHTYIDTNQGPARYHGAMQTISISPPPKPSQSHKRHERHSTRLEFLIAKYVQTHTHIYRLQYIDRHNSHTSALYKNIIYTHMHIKRHTHIYKHKHRHSLPQTHGDAPTLVTQQTSTPLSPYVTHSRAFCVVGQRVRRHL